MVRLKNNGRSMYNGIDNGRWKNNGKGTEDGSMIEKDNRRRNHNEKGNRRWKDNGKNNGR